MNLFRAYRISSVALVLIGTTMYGVAEPRIELAVLAFVLVGFAWIVTGGGDRDRAVSPVVPRWVINGGIILVTASMLLAWLRESGLNITGDIENTVGRFSRYLIWLQLVKMFEPARPRDQAQLLALSVMLVVGACLTNVTLPVGVLLLMYLPLLGWTCVLFQLYAASERAPSRAKHVALQPRSARAVRRINAGICAGVALVGIGVFVIMPRGFGERMLGTTPIANQGYETAFDDNVQLGGSGIISESRKPVGEVQVFTDGQPSGPRRHLLRGAVLDQYDREKFVWEMSEGQEQSKVESAAWMASRLNPNLDSYIKVRLRSVPTNYIFTMLEPIDIAFEDGIRYSEYEQTGAIERRERGTPIAYSVAYDEPGLSGKPIEAPLGEPIPPFDSGSAYNEARTVLEERGIDLNSASPEIRHIVVRAFVDHLSSTCDYTLEMTAPRVGQDPIDMFLEIRRGHCEYFASALAAMCMSVGIEARVITGYATEEYDNTKDRHIIRENHAHAWIEARIFKDLWRAYDPSPREAVAAAIQPRWSIAGMFRRALDAVEMAWTESVVTFGESSRTTPNEALNKGLLGSLERLIQRAEQSPISDRSAERLIQRILTGLIVGLVAGGVTAGLLLLGRKGVDRVIDWFRWVFRPRLFRVFARGHRARAAQHGAVYARTLHLLKKAGFAKPHWQPALAHARAVEDQNEPIGRAARDVIELYYAERFGGRAWTREHDTRANKLLAQLARSVRDLHRSDHSEPKHVG